MVKQLRQVDGVRQVKVEDFKQGIFAVTPQDGAKLSVSALRAAAERSGFTPEKIVPPEGAADERPQAAAEEPLPDGVSQLLNRARRAFRQGKCEPALKPAQQAVERLADGTEENKRHLAEAGQLLSLIQFARGQFEEASAAAHTALHHGKLWDWKTLSGHYGDPKDYLPHLRALEKQVRENPSAGNRFLLGYHYLMLGHREAALAQLRRVAEANPDDKVVSKLLERLAKTQGAAGTDR